MAKKTSDSAHNEKHASSDHNKDFLVVGLGASAGGIQALKEFFARVPIDSGIAFVVILHMSPEHESKLAQILQTTSPIPVTQVTARVKVVPNHVYVIPPNQNLAITDGHLALTNMIGNEERRSPVDLFFRTLAETNERRAVSVILSGTGANGSMGLKRIKEHGGIAFVQDPNEAEYTDMPRNAIATGLVDYVLPVSEIPGRIVSFNEHRNSLQIPEQPQEIPASDEQALREIFTQLRLRTGHDFSNYKRATILRRIERRLGLRELSGIPAYANFLKENAQEAQALMKDLLISVTNFFRDPESISALSTNILPRLFKGKTDNDYVRVWVAGCATGEEAYTIAMLLNEVAGKTVNAPQIQLFATDLGADAIAVAREGHYTEAEIADVSADRLQRYFVKDAEGYRVRRELRETILFAAHNIIKDPPFSHLDLISCRNLLIYLNRTAQKRVLEVMHFALNPGGFLFLGASESIEGGMELFSIIEKEHHIYQGRPIPTRTSFPVPEITFRAPQSVNVIDKENGTERGRAVERLSYIDLHQRLLEQFGPPSVVINEKYDILHLSENVGRYLQFAAGEPSKNLINVVRPELRMDLRATLYQAVQHQQNCEARGLQVNTADGVKVVNILVRPVLLERDPTRGFILVIFQEIEATEEQKSRPAVVKAPEPVARQLEVELVHSKQQLQATIEQYEVQQEELRASNEELQAMNEELRSAAEELETSKEELQSVNEELTTVNQELKIKIEELSQANNDFTNLMNSTDIGTIFLDRALRVKLFTPKARDAFNLIRSDAGRSLLDITNKIAYDDLLPDIERVLKTLRSVDREIRTSDGLWYLMRILPYRTTDDRIEGVVLTFVDINESKIYKTELERARASLESKVIERTRDLTEANRLLLVENAQRREAEDARLKLLSQLVTAQEEERGRLARDLHDEFGQQLTALRLNLERLQQESGEPQDLQATLQQMLKITARLDSDVDFLARELRPVVLDDLGIVDALANYVALWGEHFEKISEFHTSKLDDERLPQDLENNLYRIAQEALNNVAKHSQGTRVDVILERRENQIVLIIEDDGKGFSILDESYEPNTLGFAGMRERAALVGGSLEIESSPDKGTTIYVRVPLQHPKES